MPPDPLARGLGVLLLPCTLLYAVPRTALLGALLLTGSLGGATAIQLGAGTPVFSHLLFGAYLGGLLWAGLLLRDGTLSAALFPRGRRQLRGPTRGSPTPARHRAKTTPGPAHQLERSASPIGRKRCVANSVS